MSSTDPRETIRRLLAEQDTFQSSDLVERTGLSRQALSRHLARAVEGGWLVREGAGRGTRYRAASGPRLERREAIEGLEESRLSSALLDWLGEQATTPSAGATAILAYALSELVNNAIDHSGAEEVEVEAELRGDRLHASVRDAGIGALENLRARLGLEDHLHALQELSKGKTTTWPEAHSGEGIFFTSKMVERFRLTANDLAWIVDNTLEDQTVQAAEAEPGTRVELELSLDTRRTPEAVFDRYTHDFEFDTSRCVLRLFEYGTSFISRSEAKRLVANLERFRVVVLDFHGVERVGQGFVDQVFRVWANQHPEVRLVPERMGPAVEFMVRRGLGGGRRPGAE